MYRLKGIGWGLNALNNEPGDSSIIEFHVCKVLAKCDKSDDVICDENVPNVVQQCQENIVGCTDPSGKPTVGEIDRSELCR